MRGPVVTNPRFEKISRRRPASGSLSAKTSSRHNLRLATGREGQTLPPACGLVKRHKGAVIPGPLEKFETSEQTGVTRL